MAVNKQCSYYPVNLLFSFFFFITHSPKSRRFPACLSVHRKKFYLSQWIMVKAE